MPAWDETFVESGCKRLRLSVDPRRRRHGQGTRLGAGPGASLEFHDHRQYVPGDDLRHLDWRVLARSDQYMLRRFRQEVSPRVEVFLDCSASMAISPAKAELAASLGALLARLALACGSRPRLWALARQSQRLDGGDAAAWQARLRQQVCDGVLGLAVDPAPELSPGADRYLISDGLCQAGGQFIVNRLGQGAGRVCLVQVLTKNELEPEPLGAVRLVDPEGGHRDLVHDDELCRHYRERLARHQAGWQAALNGRGAGLITCVVEEGSEAALKKLLRAGIVEAVAA